MIKITEKFTLIDTTNDNCEDYISDFKDWCEDNGYSYSGEDENDLVATDDWGIKIKFMSWFYDTKQIEEQDFWDSFKDATEHRNLDCVITGKLGLWNGEHEIVPTCMELIYGIYKCLEDAQGYIISLDGENKVMTVTNIHHDGRNEFEIRLVNGENYDKLVYWDDEQDGNIADFFANKDNFEDFYEEYFN
jgi:hypothetical protein